MSPRVTDSNVKAVRKAGLGANIWFSVSPGFHDGRHPSGGYIYAAPNTKSLQYV